MSYIAVFLSLTIVYLFTLFLLMWRQMNLPAISYGLVHQQKKVNSLPNIIFLSFTEVVLSDNNTDSCIFGLQHHE